jgi:hypothetical protein
MVTLSAGLVDAKHALCNIEANGVSDTRAGRGVSFTFLEAMDS